MMPDIFFLVFVHARHVHQNFGTHIITFNDFMVIVESCLHFSYYINDLPDDVICNIAIYADDTTLDSKFDQVSNLWQQLELASELESDL